MRQDQGINIDRQTEVKKTSKLIFSLILIVFKNCVKYILLLPLMEIYNENFKL